MRKLMLVLFVLGISLQSFAGPKEKDVLGTWKYKVETDMEDLTGTISIEKKEGNLAGEVNTDNGELLPFSKVEIQENDVLYMELNTGYELMKVTVTIDGKTFKGTVSSDSGSFPITGEKVE
jgi:hypothetical protein